MNCDNQCCENRHEDYINDRYGINVTAMAHTQEPLVVEQAAELVPVDMRKPGTKITFWTFDGWQTWQFQPMDIREWLLPESWKQETTFGMDSINDLQNQIDSIQIGGWAISQEFGDNIHIGISQKALTEKFDGVANLDLNGKVPEALLPYLPDEEDVTNIESFLKFKDKPYDVSVFSGLGKKILRKNMVNGTNILTQAMVNAANTVYIIQYDFDLNDENIVFPSNCVLQFSGGSLSNGSITGNMTRIVADNVAIFDDIVIDGYWNVPEITSAWFKDATTEDNVIKQIFNLTNDDLHNVVTIEDGTYPVATLTEQTGAITVGSNTEVNLIGKIKQLSNSFYYGYVIDIAAGAKNIYIHGSGTIEGDKFIHDYQTGALALGNKIESTNASNTPKSIVLYTSDEEITGTLNVSDADADSVYWVRNRFNETLDPSGEIGYNTTNYTYYKVRSGSWKVVNSCESGHGIRLCNCYNVTISDITIEKCTGDCIYIGITNTPATNITLRNLVLDEGSRQGISITSAKNVVIENCTIKNVNRTAPQSGIDIEPNANSVVDNIVIKNCNILNCSGYGIELFNKHIESINDVLIQNVMIDGCYRGIGSTRVNITGLTIDSVIIKNHNSRGLYLYPYEDDESEVDLSNIRDVNITNVFVDDQDSSITSPNVWIWAVNSTIKGCTFKGISVLRSYNYADENHPTHGLIIEGTILDAPTKIVRLHTGCVMSQCSINCGLLRLPNGHTQFIGCDINCNGISADAAGSSATSYNTFTACSVYSSSAIRFNMFCNITQSIISCTSNLHLGKYSVVTGNKITAKIRCNYDQVAVNNNQIVLGTSVIGTDNYVVRLDGGNCNVSNNDITISDDDTSITAISGIISSTGAGGVVRNNNITLSGERNYCRYAIYTPVAYTPMVVENNSITISSAFINNVFNLSSGSPIPYADISKNRIGATADRPTLLACNKTFQYFDTTLGYPIWWTGTAWVDSTGTTV